MLYKMEIETEIDYLQNTQTQFSVKNCTKTIYQILNL